MNSLEEELLEIPLFEVETDFSSKESKERLWAYFKKLKPDDKYITRVSRWRKRGTARQRRYYFSLLQIICKHTGDDVSDLHEYIKYRFLSKDIRINLVGTDEFVMGSTKELTTDGYTTLIENVKKMAAESKYGLILPEPGDMIFAE